METSTGAAQQLIPRRWTDEGGGGRPSYGDGSCLHHPPTTQLRAQLQTHALVGTYFPGEVVGGRGGGEPAGKRRQEQSRGQLLKGSGLATRQEPKLPDVRIFPSAASGV